MSKIQHMNVKWIDSRYYSDLLADNCDTLAFVKEIAPGKWEAWAGRSLIGGGISIKTRELAKEIIDVRWGIRDTPTT